MDRAVPVCGKAAVTAILGLALAAGPAAAQQGLGFQSGSAAPVGAPLNLTSPTFLGAPQRVAPAAAPSAAPAPTAPQSVPRFAAPMPTPRPADAPARAEPAVAAPAAPVEPRPLPVALGYAPLDTGDVTPMRPFFPFSAPPTAQAAQPDPQPAASAPTPAVATAPAIAPSFQAPLPSPRPVEVAALSPSAAVAAVPVQTPAPVLATRGTATTMVIPAAPAGVGVQPVLRPTPATGPVLAALPTHDRDWPRFVPGARGEDRLPGAAGERVIPDPGVRLTCLPSPVRRALNDVALRFGPVIVRSTMRGSGRFIRSDAWRGSYHRDCRAADFRVAGAGAGVMAFLRSRPDLGGVKRYRNGLIHIDDGPRRSW